MATKEKIYDLPTFRATLGKMTHTQSRLTPDTHKRYKRGMLPQTLVDLLLAKPELAEALYADLKQGQQEAA